MGKNRHSKDKLYIVASEYHRDWGGFKRKDNQLPFRCLPFYCCGLSLLPFTVPLCTKEGVIFSADNILPYIEKYHRNPVTGKALEKKDLIVLHFHKNHDGHYHCPVTYKEFNEFSHIVANRKSGNVYSNDAIDALCRKPKKWVDFFTNEPFSSSDLITIQNPHDRSQRQIEKFDYVTTGKEVPTSGIAADEGSLEATMKRTNLSHQIIEESKQKEDERKQEHNKIIRNVHAPTIKEDSEKKERMRHSLFTTSKQAASFTSTVVDISYNSEFRELTDRETRFLIYSEIKKKKLKGYVRLVTDLGILNLELSCDKVPETCDNFLRHCESGYYNDTIFHRSIQNFMIQGGDPTGTGTGGQSAFENGLPFPDEFHPHLVHKGTGILSMANSGKNTNLSQFFITYKSLVGGFDTLRKIEQLETTKGDRPKVTPKILETIVFKNPFAEHQKEIEDAKIKAAEDEAKKVLIGKTTSELLDPMQNHSKRHTKEIGKYTKTQHLKVSSSETNSILNERKRPPTERSIEILHAIKKTKGDAFSTW